MSATIEELPLFRAKARGITSCQEHNPNVGPGSFNPTYSSSYDHPRAPFNSTSERFPASHCNISTYSSSPLPESAFNNNYDERNTRTNCDNNNIITDSCMIKRGIASCPFRSDVMRFAEVDSTFPGPGSYELTRNWVDKQKPRVYTFTQTARDDGNNSPQFETNRRSYYDFADESDNNNNNHHYKACSKKPTNSISRAAHFAKYSGRKSPVTNSNPGPGAYEVGAKERSLYTAKPSFMFATKTPRSTILVRDTPGPGAYQINNDKKSVPKYMSETFSAFNSSSPRFNLSCKEDFPGPGEYTGNIAPRRPWSMYCNSENIPFNSTAKRFAETLTTLPGPGLYESRIPSKRFNFNTNKSFNSTLPRMPMRNQTSEPIIDEEGSKENVKLSSIRLPRRVQNKSSVTSKTVPVIYKPNNLANNLSYDIRYDWPKPQSKLNTTFGTEHRFPYRDTVNNEGGHLLDHENSAFNNKASNESKRFGNSNWSRAARFGFAPLSADGCSGEYGGPGEYYNATTFLKKTFNSTIGEDTT